VSWRLKIRHVSGYSYAGEVSSSYNEARVTPLTTDRQSAIETSVQVTPPVPTLRYWDYWGTLVDAFDVHTPHEELLVVGQSVVETSSPDEKIPSVTWDELGRPGPQDEFAEFVVPTTYVPGLVQLDDLHEVMPVLAAAGPPPVAVEAAVEWVHSRLKYTKGVTDVTTTAADALRGGTGVCQDFAHLTLAVLRGLGIPARYVSGYLYPASDAGVGTTATGESHAWVEAWTGDWWGLDPTHGGQVGERHVVVGRGRDYADVAPLRGIYHGARATAMTVSVELSRLA